MPDYTYTGYNSELEARARELRKNLTRQERRLWYGFLRDYPIRFTRQRAVGSYIVDFYCSKARLVVELDGSQHYTEEGEQYDATRSAVLAGYGLRILRFSNHDVDVHYEAVCETIDMAVGEAMRERE